MVCPDGWLAEWLDGAFSFQIQDGSGCVNSTVRMKATHVPYRNITGYKLNYFTNF
jgi:hypothetical protein